MFDVFENYLRDYGIFNHGELDVIRSVSFCKTLSKKEYLLREGDICRHKTFVCKGCLRSYYIDNDATEHILNFAIERHWINAELNFPMGENSSTIVDVLEDSEVIQWSNENFAMLLATLPAFNLFYRKYLEASLNERQRRIVSILSNDALGRYEYFINNFPNLYNRVPLYMIASYLGMSRETISRARNTNQYSGHHHRESILKATY
ncbi:MAG: Crp/Fnr family transcriptional regulator [Ginsengibacter sp.]